MAPERGRSIPEPERSTRTRTSKYFDEIGPSRDRVTPEITIQTIPSLQTQTSRKITRVKENCRPVSTRQSARVVDVAAPQPAEWAEASASEADALFLNFFLGRRRVASRRADRAGDPAPRVTSGPPRDLTHARSRPFRANIDCYKYTPRARPVWVGSGTVIVEGHRHITPTHVVSPRPHSALLLPLLRRSAQPPSDLRLVAASTFPRASRDDRLERLARVLERLHATHEVYPSHLAHAVDAPTSTPIRSMLMIHKSSTFASNASPAGSLGAALPCTAPDLARRVP